MAGQPSSPNWWLAFRGTLATQVFAGGGVIWFLLGQQEQNFSWPVLFFFAPGVSISVTAVPYSGGDFSGFTTSSALGPTDFNSWGAVTSVGVALGAGGSELSVNFYSVDHSPNPIGVEGVDIGLGVNVGWCPGRFKVLDWLMVANQGSTIGQPMAWLDDSPDLSDAVADATSDYVQNNTDPSYIV